MRRILPTLLIFVAILAMLIVIEARSAFPDPDSFYHAKIALIITEQGFIDTLPWLHYTPLAEEYVDFHLGYHLLLVPFVTVFDPLTGMKVSAVVFGTVAFYALYRFLRSMRVPHPQYVLALSVLSFSFFHRMSLPRAPALSVAILLWCAHALIHRKRWMITLSAAVYVWFYYGWPLLLPLLLAVLVADFFVSRLEEQDRSLGATLAGVWRRERQSIGHLLLGIAIGLVVNPYFPQNVVATARDVVKLAVVNYHHLIPVGREWYPMSPEGFFVSSPFLVASFALGCALLLSVAATQTKPPSREQMFPFFVVLLLAGGFFVLTLKSNRFVEYAVPFLTLATGGLAQFCWPFMRQHLFNDHRHWFSWRPGRWLIGATCVLAAISFTYAQVQNSIPNPAFFTRAAYQPIADWLIANVPEGELVFHNGWDFSLILMYLDDRHRYLVGLDPTYMYTEYYDDFVIWSDLVSGTEMQVEKVITHFGAQTVVIDTRLSTNFEKNIQDSGLFELVASSQTVHLYAVK